MKKTLTLLTAAFVIPPFAAAQSDDDPDPPNVMIDQLEVRSSDGPDPRVLEAQAWIGGDLHKLWLKTEVEYVDGHTEEAEVQVLYSRAVSPEWDLQIGMRRDIRPEPKRNWLAVGLQDLEWYGFEVDVAAFFGDNGRIAARLEAEYEWTLSERWELAPELTVDLHSKDDETVEVGAGLSELELGLRLLYAVSHEVAPYIGVNWCKKFGNTADFARAEDEETSEVQLVAGVRAWF